MYNSPTGNTVMTEWRSHVHMIHCQ